MRIWIEVIDGTIADAEKTAHELRKQSGGHLYTIMEYNKLADCIDAGVKFRLNCMKQRGEICEPKNADAEIDKAYKQGWEDCKRDMLKRISGGDME